MKDRLRRLLPTQRAMHENRWLRWLGPALNHPRLWHMSRRGIALGVAIGVFFGLLIPIAQIPVSAVAAVVLRANLPTAVASTLVTNPLTFAPVYYAAWRTGNAILGGRTDGAQPPPLTPDIPDAGENWFQRTWAAISNVGKPLMLGLLIFAATFGLVSYLLISAGWHALVRIKRWRRRRSSLTSSRRA